VHIYIEISPRYSRELINLPDLPEVQIGRISRRRVESEGIFRRGSPNHCADEDEQSPPERCQEPRPSRFGGEEEVGEESEIRSAIGEVPRVAGVPEGQRVHIGPLPERVAAEARAAQRLRLAQRNPQHLDVRPIPIPILIYTYIHLRARACD
jgi:hypothetical protein